MGNLFNSILLLFLCLFLSATLMALKLPSVDSIKRLGKHCTGVCDEPSQICGNNHELYNWCDKNCTHKFNLIEICQKYSSIAGKPASCPLSSDEDRLLQVNAAEASDIVYDWGEKGGYNKGSFQEIEHLKGKSLLVAWAGIKDKVLYIAYRGTWKANDILKDMQIGFAGFANRLGLGEVAARGAYNDSVNEAIQFYHRVIKAQGRYCMTVITGHSLGGAFAANVGDKVARGNPTIKTITFNAPGSDFVTSKIGEGYKDTSAEHVITSGDIVNKVGKSTYGTKTLLPGPRKDPLTSHKIGEVSEILKKGDPVKADTIE